MSFSSEVRNEAARLIPDKDCCRKAELAAILLFSGSMVETESGYILKITGENAAIARKAYQYLKEIGRWAASVESEPRKRFRKTRAYEVSVPVQASDYDLLQEMGFYPVAKRQVPWTLLGKNCCRRAFIRGLFLSRGFISRPEGNYHLELVLNDSRLAADTLKILNKVKLEARQVERKNHLVIYIKDSETISDLLRLIGANKALLDFENVRILKSMRNAVNRQVNCETANLAKTIDAAVRQVELMEGLMNSQKWNQLSPQLKELARLRLQYPEYTLKELGDLLSPALSKSGVAYRMRRLEKAAEELLDRS